MYVAAAATPAPTSSVPLLSHSLLPNVAPIARTSSRCPAISCVTPGVGLAPVPTARALAQLNWMSTAVMARKNAGGVAGVVIAEPIVPDRRDSGTVRCARALRYGGAP